ncbi:MAG: TIGR02921 family PEP-CTERM protein [Pleurocapsa minor HA4230-MV1]|jgi:putative PEP-CTERM system integral membrane protein|nr:TIGR02921 family PEP-CTERM protein [Pleurocapsa minor HA4230-MV1]
MENPKSLRNTIWQIIFWGWNLIFLSLVYFGITPFIGILLIIATFDGTIPLDFALTLLALIAVPTVSTIYGAKYLSKRPQDLMRWFYGVEAPLITWCLVRLFLIRELTFANTFILGTLLVCIVAFAIEVLQGYRGNLKIFSWVQMITHTLMLFTGIYLGTILLFYALPVAAYILMGVCGLAIAFFSFNWVEGFWHSLTSGSWLWFSIAGIFSLVMFSFSSALFVGMPFAITNLYLNSGKKIIQAFAQQHSKQKAIQVGVAVVATWLIIFNISNQQPQVKAFSLLEQSSLNKQELLAASGTIRQGLINANLYPYRYLSTRSGNNHIYNMYNSLLPEPISRFMQERYNQLLSPFLYQGSRDDVDKSAQLYAEFFDTPIQKAERDSVRHAIQSTAIVDQAKAGLLNIDQKKVWLAKQEVNIAPHGSWADVEIHEVYENQTNDVEEILYYFSLPESAAITGLWLGDTEDLDRRFAYQVSPRGAAQEVYNSQVNRTRPVDPALLEQVGPGQYRLRAFPVPPKRTVGQIEIGLDRPKMHLWLTYQVMQQEQGWALPRLAEKRNIFWTWQTQRIRNGQKQWLFADAWLEDFSGTGKNLERETYQLNLEDGYSVAVKPLSQQDYALPKNQKYALILDSSYSMGNQLAEVQQSIEWWQKNLDSLASNDVDLYLTNADPKQAQRLEDFNDLHLNQLTFYGSLQTDEMLWQFQMLRDNQDYDAVLLLTDEGSYELASDRPKLPAITSPLWMVHLGGQLPKAYEDDTLQAIQNSHGGVATNLPTVIKRLATEQAEVKSVVDGYSWTVTKSDSKTNSKQGLEPIAARQLVFNLGHQDKNQQSIEKLDAIHQIAKHHKIVTPYSSMIVLVNEQQREQLKAAEAKADRFEREIETGTEQLDTPFNPFETAEISGVPEPDLWILLSIVALALFLVLQKQKLNGSLED